MEDVVLQTVLEMMVEPPAVLHLLITPRLLDLEPSMLSIKNIEV